MDKFLLSNTDGKKDFIMTLTAIAFAVVSACILVGMLESFTLFGHDITLRKLESGEIAAYLGTLFSAYVARRNGIFSGKSVSPKPSPKK